MSITTGFVVGTQVLLFSGEVKNIEDITSDDIIVTKDLEFDNFESSRGIIGNSTATSMVRLSVTNTGLTSDDTLSNIQDINMISTQKVYVVGSGWKLVTDLVAGDVLHGPNSDSSEFSTVVSHETLSVECDVIHLDSVEPNGNYFAGFILVADNTTNNS